MTVDICKDNWKDEVLDFQGIVIVDFYGSWCMPCKMLTPILEKVLESRPDIKLARVDIDENDELVKDFHIMSVPTLKFFKCGEEMETLIGLASESKLLEILKRL